MVFAINTGSMVPNLQSPPNASSGRWSTAVKQTGEFGIKSDILHFKIMIHQNGTILAKLPWVSLTQPCQRGGLVIVERDNSLSSQEVS